MTGGYGGVLAAAVCTMVAGGTVLVWLRRRWVAVTVEGQSMAPTLASGDRVLVRRCPAARLRRGQVVVIGQPSAGDGDGDGPGEQPSTAPPRWNIKRLAALPGDRVPDAVRAAAGTAVVPIGALVVLGDNARSCDSRQIGLYPADRLLGVVTRRLRPGQALGAGETAY